MPHPDPRIAEAEKQLAAAIAFPADKPQPVTVDIRTGERSGNQHIAYAIRPVGAAKEEERTPLSITLTAIGVDYDPLAAQKALTAALRQFPAMAAYAQLVPDEELAAQLHARLKTEPVNPKLLEWYGFDQKVLENQWRIPDYALDFVDSTAFGVELNLRVPTAADENAKPLRDRVIANLTQRLPAIKQMLTERVAKYIGINMKQEGKTDAEITAALANAAEQMNLLQIEITGDTNREESLRIRLQSPQQKEAAANHKGHRFEDPANAAELTATNPLHLLSRKAAKGQEAGDSEPSPQLNKALGRSFLFAGEGAMDIFPLIAGRRDIVNALGKELTKLAQAHPEKAASYQEILASDLFKRHEGWGQTKETKAITAPPPPFFAKPRDPANQIELTLSVPQSKVKEIIDALACGPQTAKAVSPARAAQSEIIVPQQAAELPPEQPAHQVDALKAALAGILAQAGQQQAPAH